MKCRSKEDLITEACIELVTFSLIEDSGFKKIISCLNDFFPSDSQVNINIDNIKDKLNIHAQNVRNLIKEEVKNNIICLKIDATTRLDRSMLGLNIQFIKHGKIMLRTLGIKELKERHTAEYLKKVILKTLKEYEINYTQIYSITTDNGANMTKTVNLLQQYDEMDDNNEQEPEDIDSNEEVTVEEYYNFIEIENLANDLLTSFNTNIISLVRCWAHTLQLCVDDALKDRNQIIAKARKAAKKLRTPTILVLIKKMKSRKPIVDCSTRWHSTCDMLERLNILQDFCKDMAPSHNELHLKEGEWTQINNIVSALLPAKIATKKLQSEQLTIGDCYSSWITCQLETSKINNIISDLLVNSMKRRESKLLENGAFLAGVFLDARYQVLLKEEQKLKAQLHLKETWETIKMLNESVKYNEVENSSTDSSELETDELEILLKSKENKVIKNSSNNETGSDIAVLINNYNTERRLNKNTNILKYLESNKNSKPELYKLS